MYIPRKDISLRRLSTVSLVTNLWSSGYLKDDLQIVFDKKKTLYKDRVSLTKKAKDIIQLYNLPSLIIGEVIEFVEWISSDFILYLDSLINNEFFLHNGDIGCIVKNIKWDMHGGIDEVETFKNMKYTNNHYNYIISTFFCLEDDIPAMWARCSPIYKPFSLKSMYSEEFCSYATFIIYYWTCKVKNRTFRIHILEDPMGLFNDIRDCSTELKMLVVSLHIYNIHAFKYFWRQLDEKERVIAIEVLCLIYDLDDLYVLNDIYDMLKNSVGIILFVLAQINEQQQLMVIEKCLPQMIVHFWQCWQMHHVILPLFETYISFLDASSYKKLFRRLLMQNGDYCPKEKLLYRMWMLSPPHLQCLIDDTEKRLMFFGNVENEKENRLFYD
ncbi:hypothetical protein PGB90_004860 [Kerria lacca]